MALTESFQLPATDMFRHLVQTVTLPGPGGETSATGGDIQELTSRAQQALRLRLCEPPIPCQRKEGLEHEDEGHCACADGAAGSGRSPDRGARVGGARQHRLRL